MNPTKRNTKKNSFGFIKKNLTETISISLVATILFSIFNFNYLIVFLILLIPLSFLFLNEKTFVFVSIVIFISATGDSLQNFRNIFTIVSIIFLFFFFLKRYGINTSIYPIPPRPFLYISGLLIFSIGLSTALTGFNSVSLEAFFRAIVFFLICYFLYAFLEEKFTLSNIYILIGGIFVAGILLSISVYYDLGRSGFLLFIFDVLITRWAGAFGNPNSLALIISMNIILLVILFYSEKISKLIKKYLLPVLLFNNIIILILTNSRAALLALMLSMFFLFYFLQRKIIIYFFFIALFLLLLYTFEPLTKSLIDLYLRLETVSQRDYFWRAGVDIMKDYPILGVGPEIYPTKFYTYLPTSGSYFFNLYVILQKPHPHNYSLWLITEMGLLGWICAVSLFGIYFYMAAKIILVRKKIKDEIYLFALGLFSIGILVFVRSFFEVEGVFAYGYISRDLPFWISYVILAYLYKYRQQMTFTDFK